MNRTRPPSEGPFSFGKALVLCEIARAVVKPGSRHCSLGPVLSALPALDLSRSAGFRGSATARFQLRLVQCQPARDLPGKGGEVRNLCENSIFLGFSRPEVDFSHRLFEPRPRDECKCPFCTLRPGLTHRVSPTGSVGQLGPRGLTRKGESHDPHSGVRVRAHRRDLRLPGP